MTKNEVEEACYQICEWIKALPDVPIGFYSEFEFKEAENCFDDQYAIRIHNSAKTQTSAAGERLKFVDMEVTFIDGATHRTQLTPGNLADVKLEMKVAMLKAWPKIKENILAKLAKEIADIKAREDKKRKEEEALCATVTDFKL